MTNRTNTPLTLLMIGAAALGSALFAGSTATPPPPSLKGVLITLEGDVDQGMTSFVARAIERARKHHNPDIIVLEINTFGGLLDAAFTISDTLLAIEGIKTVAFVDKKAISAGALIALSAQELYMRPATTIGDCAPVISGQEGPVMLGEKIQSPLRARFRTLAEQHGYPSLLSQAMVSEELEIIELKRNGENHWVTASEWKERSSEEQKKWEEKKTLVRAGELLTLTDREAEQYGFSAGTVDDVAGLMKQLGVVSWEKVEISWAEQVARFLGKMAPLLMLIGFGALYMEFQTPGFGIFGIVGIAALVLVFGGQSIAGLADHTAVALLILGAALMLLEMFVFPGTWIAGIFGLLFLALAMLLTIGEATPVLPAAPLSPDPTETIPSAIDTARIWSNLSTVLFSALAALLFPIVFSRAIARWIPARAGIALAATLDDSKAPIDPDLPEIGDRGVTQTLLRPTGKILIGGRSVEATAQNSYIEQGMSVEVTAIRDGRITVRPVEER